MKRAIPASLAMVLLVGCSGLAGNEAGETKTITVTVTPTLSPSASPTPQTPTEKLEAVLAANPQIQADICYQADKLRSVGWQEELLPSLMLLYLTNVQQRQLESVGRKLEAVIEDLVHRCT